MRILILNWRDVRSSRAGGAEVLTHEVARRLVERSHHVTLLTSRDGGLPADEEIDGVRVVRRGSELTTRFHAPAFARAAGCDVVVDQVNTLPYLAPLWSSRPALLFIHQLARNVWWHEAPLPLAGVGWLAEPVYLQTYRRTPVVTVSESTRDDLRRLGLHGAIHVLPMAVSTQPVEAPGPRRLEGDLLAIGRLTRSKRYDHAIRALELVRRSHPRATLTIVGDGPDRERLEAVAHRLGLAGAVTFAGRVTEAEKVRLLTTADLLVGTSAREGWGLTVTEAAVRGTPAAVYDVPGFRASVLHGRTGLLCDQEPEALAAAAGRLLADRSEYERLRVAAWEHARALSWSRTAAAFEHALADAAAQG